MAASLLSEIRDLILPRLKKGEAVVNALAHRDYRSTANVQVYIFKDQLEVVSPGGLPAGMTEADLGIKSIPRNPLLFGILHRMEAVEHIGSGIRRIRNLCREYKVAEPRIEVAEHWFTIIFPLPGMAHRKKFHDDTPQVVKLVEMIHGEMRREDIMYSLGLKDRMHFVNSYLKPAMDEGIVEMTIPEKPRSRRQRYRLTSKGKALRNRQKGEQ